MSKRDQNSNSALPGITAESCDLVLSFSINQASLALFVNDTTLINHLQVHLLVCMNHRHAVRQDMWPPKPIYERYPQVWILLGLLFVTTGLYLGFEVSYSFLYVMVGFFCCVFGVALFALRFMERPRTQAASEPRKPIHFDSANSGPVEVAPAASNDETEPAAEAVSN